MEYTPISGRELPRFSAIKTFFRLPHVTIDADYQVGIMGIPFDGAVSYRPGARFAPSAVRELSSLGRGFHLTRQLNWFEQLKVADIGDCPTVPISIDQTYEKIQHHAGKIFAQNKQLISIGGDHSTTLPLLRAAKEKYGPLRLIHFDAHLDTYPAAWGCEFHHGAFVRHAVEEGLIIPEQTLQIGIRGPLAGADDLDFVKKHRLNVTTVDDVRIPGLNSFIEHLPAFDAHPTYLSFDIDCLDPAYAPGTGTPVPGGLTSYEVQRILRALSIKNLIGADVVEICPAYDPTQITALTGVDVVFELLCIMAAAHR